MRRGGNVPASDKIHRIYGIPFGPAPGLEHLNDYAQCKLCGDVVDVGGELRAHVEYHEELKREMEGV